MALLPKCIVQCLGTSGEAGFLSVLCGFQARLFFTVTPIKNRLHFFFIDYCNILAMSNPCHMSCWKRQLISFRKSRKIVVNKSREVFIIFINGRDWIRLTFLFLSWSYQTFSRDRLGGDDGRPSPPVGLEQTDCLRVSWQQEPAHLPSRKCCLNQAEIDDLLRTTQLDCSSPGWRWGRASKVQPIFQN